MLKGQEAAKLREVWNLKSSADLRNRALDRFSHLPFFWLSNALPKGVPDQAALFRPVFEDVLARAEVPRSKIQGWAFHPGGRDVLLALRERLQLSAHDVRWSETVLREFGNLSSPSVFFVLQAAFADSAPSGYWWMSSFGAGFSCHGALLEVD
jgi:alkylresorcinol/alkylpyrone synthase